MKNGLSDSITTKRSILDNIWFVAVGKAMHCHRLMFEQMGPFSKTMILHILLTFSGFEIFMLITIIINDNKKTYKTYNLLLYLVTLTTSWPGARVTFLLLWSVAYISRTFCTYKINWHFIISLELSVLATFSGVYCPFSDYIQQTSLQSICLLWFLHFKLFYKINNNYFNKIIIIICN